MTGVYGIGSENGTARSRTVVSGTGKRSRPEKRRGRDGPDHVAGFTAALRRAANEALGDALQSFALRDPAR